MQVQIGYTIKASLIADLMITCFEGGSNYWLGGVKSYTVQRTEGHEGPWYADEAAWDSPFVIEFFDVEDENKVWEFNEVLLKEGFELLAEKYPKVMSSIIEEHYDADDADTLLQLALFRTLVYG